jgi:hypothetical protein
MYCICSAIRRYNRNSLPYCVAGSEHFQGNKPPSAKAHFMQVGEYSNAGNH